MDRRTFLQLAAGFSLGPISGPLSATAQAPWPTRSMTIVVPFAPGGQADLAARPVALGLARSWDNRSSSTIARAPAVRSGRRSSQKPSPTVTPC